MNTQQLSVLIHSSDNFDVDGLKITKKYPDHFIILLNAKAGYTTIFIRIYKPGGLSCLETMMHQDLIPLIQSFIRFERIVELPDNYQIVLDRSGYILKRGIIFTRISYAPITVVNALFDFPNLTPIFGANGQVVSTVETINDNGEAAWARMLRSFENL
ncbi:hypothetical protein KC901_03570 [Patescibacteria group bacterium]|nr:hypothetical protein [Patescibacteria group bacterium]